jgi:hypothetical protein
MQVYLRLERADAHWRVVGVEGPVQRALWASDKDAVERASVASMKADLRNLVTAEEAYFADSIKYTTRISCANPTPAGSVSFCTTTGNTLGKVILGPGTQGGWSASITSAKSTDVCAIYVGGVIPAAPVTMSDPEGAPICRLAPAHSDSLPSSRTAPVPKKSARQPPAIAPRTAATPHPAASFEIVSVETKVTEQNDVFWRYAWRLTLKSTSTDPLVLRATIEFQDSDGFVVDTDEEYSLYLSPGEEKTFTGEKLITASTAANVAKTSAKVRGS